MWEDADLVSLFDLTSAVLLALLGLFVGWKGGFRGKYAAFAAYAVAFSLGAGINNLANTLWGTLDGASKPWPYFVMVNAGNLSLPVVGWALHRLLVTTGGFRGAGWWILGGGLVGGATTLWIVLSAPWVGIHPQVASYGLTPAHGAIGLRNGMMAAAAGLFAWRAASGRDRGSDTLMGLAILLYPVMHTAGVGFLVFRLTGDPVLPRMAILALVMATLLTGLWLRAFVVTRDRRMLAVALVVPVLAIIGMSATSRISGLSMASVSRTLEVVLLAYAVSRGQFLGLDTKVRWGISKTTIAAVFVAVFFVVSEGAAVLFSDRWGAGVGIGAAGALVFAIAPLMRWSDRLAARAVPKVVVGLEEAEQQFLRALRIVAADGRVSPQEEAELGRLADDLGIAPSVVLRLRREFGG